MIPQKQPLISLEPLPPVPARGRGATVHPLLSLDQHVTESHGNEMNYIVVDLIRDWESVLDIITHVPCAGKLRSLLRVVGWCLVLKTS